MPSDPKRKPRSRATDGHNQSSASGQPQRQSWRDGLTSAAREAEEPEEKGYDSGAQDVSGPVGHKWRNMQQEVQGGGGLPPLPNDSANKTSDSTGVGSKAIIFGAVLLAIVVGMLVLPFSPLVDDKAEPTATVPIAGGLPNLVSTENPAAVETVVPTHEPAQTVDSDFLVCIDPGHGGWDYGRERMDMAMFNPPWMFESEITLSMGFELRDELESRGIAVVMTRETGGAVNWSNADVNGDGRVLVDSPQGQIDGLRDELQARINVCNDAGADIMISLHLNGYDDQGVGGYQVFYNSQREFAEENKDLAVFLYREMTVVFEDLGHVTSARGYTDDLDLSADTHEYGSEQFLIMIGPEVRKPEYTIVPTDMPGVIVETLFITNQNDANFILNPANQRLLAVGWADGIVQYRDRYGN